MNRRDFLKATAAITACAAPPAGALSALSSAPDPALEVSIFRQIRDYLEAQRELNGYYWLLCHPRQFRDILDIEARERWALAYRAFRVASRERFIEYDPRAVLRDFGGPQRSTFSGEVGRLNGVQIIEPHRG